MAKQEEITTIFTNRNEDGSETRVNLLRGESGFAGSYWGQPYSVVPLIIDIDLPIPEDFERK